jgi:uncharacterized protein (TIGR02466 family)
MNDFFIHKIFATPIYVSNINREFSKEELIFVKQNKKNIKLNQYNHSSINNYVLNNIQLRDIKEIIEKQVLIYFDKIINTDNSIKPFITQSWLNFTKKEEAHHKHQHQNSIISGVLYIKANNKLDKIWFHKQVYEQLFFSKKQYNEFNSDAYFFPIETGQIVLFPSNLSHSVETKKDDNERISLAFNVFVKGLLGNKEGLTELNIS